MFLPNLRRDPSSAVGPSSAPLPCCPPAPLTLALALPMSLLDSPLGLKQEGWTPAGSLHGLEQGAQECPGGLGILQWASATVFLLWYRGIREGRWAKALGI